MTEHTHGQRTFGLRRDQPEMLIDTDTWHIIEVNHILREWFGRFGEPDPTEKLFRDYVPGWVNDHERKEEFALAEAARGKRTRDIFSSQGSAIYLPIAHTEVKCQITTEVNVEATLVIARFVDLSKQVKELEDKDAEIALLQEKTRAAEVDARFARDASRGTQSSLVWSAVALVVLFAIGVTAITAIQIWNPDASTQDVVTLGLAVSSGIAGIAGYMVGHTIGAQQKKT